jgi:hypothetical protein
MAVDEAYASQGSVTEVIYAFGGRLVSSWTKLR